MRIKYKVSNVNDMAYILATIETLYSGGDYSEEIKNLVYSLQKTKIDSLPDAEERKIIADMVIDSYIEIMGHEPSQYILYGLGSYLLLDYIKQKYKDKNAENQFLTVKQATRRAQREVISGEDNLNFFNAMYGYDLDSLHKRSVEKNDK